MSRRIPKVDSLAWRMMQFFLANPDEELTMRDAQEKFEVDAPKLYKTLDSWRDGMERVTVIRLKRR